MVSEEQLGRKGCLNLTESEGRKRPLCVCVRACMCVCARDFVRVHIAFRLLSSCLKVAYNLAAYLYVLSLLVPAGFFKFTIAM
jgi:hypothetical protein